MYSSPDEVHAGGYLLHQQQQACVLQPQQQQVQCHQQQQQQQVPCGYQLQQLPGSYSSLEEQQQQQCFGGATVDVGGVMLESSDQVMMVVSQQQQGDTCHQQQGHLQQQPQQDFQQQVQFEQHHLLVPANHPATSGLTVPVPEISPNTLAAIDENLSLPTEAFSGSCEELLQQLPEAAAAAAAAGGSEVNAFRQPGATFQQQDEEEDGHELVSVAVPVDVDEGEESRQFNQEDAVRSQPRVEQERSRHLPSTTKAAAQRQKPRPRKLVPIAPHPGPQVSQQAPVQQQQQQVPILIAPQVVTLVQQQQQQQQPVFIAAAPAGMVAAAPAAVVMSQNAKSSNASDDLAVPPAAVSQLDAIDKASDGVNIDEIHGLVSAVREKRVALGLTQTQVGRDLEAIVGGGASYSQTQICRIERLDITPRQARALKPILEKWLSIADGRHCYLGEGGNLVPLVVNKFVAGSNGAIVSADGAAAEEAKPTKKRQRRTQFPAETVAALNAEFDADPTPNQARMEELSKQFGLDYKTVRVWFCNKRQYAKNSSNSASNKESTEDNE